MEVDQLAHFENPVLVLEDVTYIHLAVDEPPQSPASRELIQETSLEVDPS